MICPAQVKIFKQKFLELKLLFRIPNNKKPSLFAAIVDDVLVSCTRNDFLQNKLEKLATIHFQKEEKKSNEFIFTNFLDILTIKELLVYDRNELYQRYIGYINQCNLIKQKTIAQVVKEFLNSNL